MSDTEVVSGCYERVVAKPENRVGLDLLFRGVEDSEVSKVLRRQGVVKARGPRERGEDLGRSISVSGTDLRVAVTGAKLLRDR